MPRTKFGNDPTVIANNTVIWQTPDGSQKVTFANWQSVIAEISQLGYTGYSGSIGSGTIPNISAIRRVQGDLNAWWSGRGDAGDGGLTPEEAAALAARFGGGGGGGFGGGGGGAAGPVYRAPDRDVIEDNIKSYVVAVTGSLNQNLIDRAVGEFLAKDKANFGSDTQAIDPVQAAKALVRDSTVYKDIHRLRPESVDEMEWVTSKQGLLRQLGVSADIAESLGTKLARVGANQEATQEAGERAFLRSTGRVQREQREELKVAGRAALGIL